MTAEIAILNRKAVALAADSAMTTTPIGSDDYKIYQARKLFELSDADPVAVMFYRTATLGAIPWDTVVTEFRREHKDTHYDSLELHAESFIAFLASLVRHIPADVQLDFIRGIVFWRLSSIHEYVQSSTKRQQPQTKVRDRFLQIVKSETARLEASPAYTQLEDIDIELQLNEAVPDWSEFIKTACPSIRINRAMQAHTLELAIAAVRYIGNNPASSGVVVAGFGQDELFPGYVEYRVDGVIANQVLATRVGSSQIGPDVEGIIRPFAQGDVIMTFIDGIHPGYPDELNSMVDEILSRQISWVRDAVKSKLSPGDLRRLLSRMRRMRKETVDNFTKRLNRFFILEGYLPIVSIVEVLPKEDLAEMAETLVNLTSFRRRFTPVAETVGGPIDVAVISRSDGFKWVKQKP